jgi:3-hydroxyisobutyrate dehydrogenase
MKKAGFIGLRTPGRPDGETAISEGIDLVVWNRTVQKAKDLGVEVAASPAGWRTGRTSSF